MVYGHNLGFRSCLLVSARVCCLARSKSPHYPNFPTKVGTAYAWGLVVIVVFVPLIETWINGKVLVGKQINNWPGGSSLAGKFVKLPQSMIGAVGQKSLRPPPKVM